MTSKAVQYGGHDYSFVSEVPDRFICQICTKVLRDPHLAVCCGQHFCESCLNKWFIRQGKESCLHCRAEGASFHHVIHKGLRSEVNQLKIRCSKHGEGCQWTGELGALKKHLESDNGCGYVLVDCPNKCKCRYLISIKTYPSSVDLHVAFQEKLTNMKRKDLEMHIAKCCYLRPYQCEFCGHKDTFEAITGHRSQVEFCKFNDPYSGHQAKCPEAPLACPNNCGSKKIKRKDMESHRSQCPEEPVECPFAEAGCKKKLKRSQLNTHATSNLQEHLSLIMNDYRETKRELLEVKGNLATAVQLLRQGPEADKETVDFVIARSMRLEKVGDLVQVLMPKFSEYRHSGKVWHSPPFYYGEGYKMCLKVYANGTGMGAGTYVTVTLILCKGKHETVYQLHAPKKTPCVVCYFRRVPPACDGQQIFNVCQYQPLSQCSEAVNELSQKEKFCTHEYIMSKLVNDCLIFNITYHSHCDLLVSVK